MVESTNKTPRLIQHVKYDEFGSWEILKTYQRIKIQVFA